LTKRESKKKCQNWSSWHDYLNVESVIIMIRSIDSNQQTKRNNAHLMLTTAMGGAIGAGARYIVPTQNEVKSLRTAADTFFSNASPPIVEVTIDGILPKEETTNQILVLMLVRPAK